MTYFASKHFQDRLKASRKLAEDIKPPTPFIHSEDRLTLEEIETLIKDTPTQDLMRTIVSPIYAGCHEEVLEGRVSSGIFHELCDPNDFCLAPRGQLEQIWASNKDLLGVICMYVLDTYIVRHHNDCVGHFLNKNGIYIYCYSDRVANLMNYSLFSLLGLKLGKVYRPLFPELDYSGQIDEKEFRSHLYGWTQHTFCGIDCANLTTPEQLKKASEILESKTDTHLRHQQVIVWSKYGKHLDLPHLDKFMV